jgi:choline dehydrogenase-like flavoprotein
LREDVLRRERLLNQNIQLFPCARLDPFKYRKLSSRPFEALSALRRARGLAELGRLVGAVMSGWRDVVAGGARALGRGAGLVRTRPLFVFANMAEQVPNPASRVTLSVSRDEMGQPRPRLEWRISPDDIRSIRRTQAIVAAACERAGLGRFFPQLLDDEPPPTTHGGYHHMGTTRMHRDPRHGVVDADCRVHGIDNLYVAGPSVFPTGGYANPTSTVVALTVRLAEHLQAGPLARTPLATVSRA